MRKRGAANRQFVVFKIGSSELALDILLAKEVVVMTDITPVPETESFVEGVMNLRGNLIPVLDFGKRLRASRRAAAPERRIIIARLDGEFVGLIVDESSEVIRVNDGMIEPAPAAIAEMGAAYIRGVI